MKARRYLKSGRLLLGVLVGIQTIALCGRAQDTNTVELIRQLQRRIGALEQKANALERAKTAETHTNVAKGKEIEALDQKVKILERNRDLDREAAEAREKSAPRVTVTEEGSAGRGLGAADKEFSLRLRGYVQTDARFYIGDHIPINDTFLIRRMRAAIEGTVFRDYDYRIMLDFGSRASVTAANNSLLQDAFVTAHYWPGFQIQVGKFKPPIGLEHQIGRAS